MLKIFRTEHQYLNWVPYIMHVHLQDNKPKLNTFWQKQMKQNDP